MKNLVFSITLNNHTFKINTSYKSTLCSYYVDDKYTTSLIFASNTYAHVKYKNVAFCGKVTKQNIWRIEIDLKTVVRKQHDRYCFISEKTIQNDEADKASEDITTGYPEKIICLYDMLIDSLSEQYSCIDNKEEFKHQLCEYLLESNWAEDFEEPDAIIEYESYDGVEDDEEPIIKKSTARELILEECRDFFISFRQSEIDSENKKSIFTLENIIKDVSELHMIPNALLQQELDNYLYENYDDLIKHNIFYSQSDELYSVGMSLYESCRYGMFMNTIEERIDEILDGMRIDDIDRSEIYAFLKSKYNEENIPSDEELEQSVMKITNDYVAFDRFYNKIFSLFNSSRINVEWDDETIQLFQRYEKDEKLIESQYLAEYEAYKFVIPYFRKHFFRKNSNNYKPVIEQLPKFTLYGSSILDILFKYNVLIDNGERVDYNENGDIDSAYEEIKNVSR